MPRSQHPFRQLDADLARTEDRTISLLQDQAKTPGREQRIQRTLVEMPDQRPFDQHSERTGRDERQNHREEEVAGKQTRQVGLKEIRCHPGDVGAEDQELAMRHVDDAHLAEDDGEPKRHQHVNRKQDQPGEALHRENRAEIANRIIAEHRSVLRRSGRLAPRRGCRRARGWLVAWTGQSTPQMRRRARSGHPRTHW